MVWFRAIQPAVYNITCWIQQQQIQYYHIRYYKSHGHDKMYIIIINLRVRRIRNRRNRSLEKFLNGVL